MTRPADERRPVTVDESVDESVVAGATGMDHPQEVATQAATDSGTATAPTTTALTTTGATATATTDDSTATGARSGRRATSGRAWGRWLLTRLGTAILTLLLVSIVVFLATSALGDPVRAILGKDYAVSPDRVAQIRSTLHLDRPLVVRYGIWLKDLLHGNLGTSVANGSPVSELIGGKVLNSAWLVLLVAVVMVPLSMALAVLAGRRRGGWIDRVITAITLALAGLPEFVTGIILVALFSTSVWHVLPAVTVLPIGARPWNRPASMVLPVATLVLAVTPYLVRILRANLLEALDSDYVELARLKGVPEQRVLMRHALPNTLVPAVQVTALQLAWLVGGVVLVEYLFDYPGIGAAMVDSVRNSDFPMVQALTMIIAAAYVVVNLVADALSILLTPRARTAMVR